MPRTIPWNTVEELIFILKAERAALDAQIAAIEATRDTDTDIGRLEVLLCRYLVFGSAKRATDWARSVGWRRFPTRWWEPQNLYDAIQHPPAGVAPALIELCERIFNTNRDKVSKTW